MVHNTLLARLTPYVLLAAMVTPLLLWRLDTYPPAWFDEGFRTNGARTFAERGVYGTYSVGGYRPFDPGLSSGPVDILSIALSFRVLGTGMLQARLAILPFTLIAIACLYAIAAMLYGRRAALFSVLLLIAAPPLEGISFLLLGRQV